MTYKSADSLHDPEESNAGLFPVEFLNSLQMSGLPPHELKLKKNTPVMLLRNFNCTQGLCNGTRMIVRELHNNLLDCEVINGPKKGTRVLIPRISCISSSKKLPFQLRRRQFPVSVCFAMTISKSQGQSVSDLGIYLPEPVFSHGQLYVALSRAKNRNRIKVLLGEAFGNDRQRCKTRNVVYKQLLIPATNDPIVGDGDGDGDRAEDVAVGVMDGGDLQFDDSTGRESNSTVRYAMSAVLTILLLFVLVMLK